MIDNNIKLYLHNRKDGIYNNSGLQIKKVKDEFFSINDVEINIPVNYLCHLLTE